MGRDLLNFFLHTQIDGWMDAGISQYRRIHRNAWAYLNPHCVAESDQRHAQHPLCRCTPVTSCERSNQNLPSRWVLAWSVKMLGIDCSYGSYQTNSERSMLQSSWYQADMSLYSSRYLFVRSKIDRQKWQPHILCKTMSFFVSRLTPLHGSPGNHAHLHRRRHAQKCK